MPLTIKRINYDWHLAGLLPVVFGTLSYILGITYHIKPWEFLWVCPVVAIATGFFVLFHNNFGISAAIAWIISGPFLYLLFAAEKTVQLLHIHHIVSVVILFIILYHFREIWNPKGFCFGVTSFCAYMAITSYLSAGEINLISRFIGQNKIVLYSGIFFIILSVATFLWNLFEQKYTKTEEIC